MALIMRSTVASLLFLGACIAFRAQVRDPNIVKVSIFYESQCEKTRDFITKQLVQHYSEIEDAILLEFVPFGMGNMTVVDDQYTFECDHGELECQTNKLHACVIKRLHGSQTKTLKVIKCLMNSKDQMEGLLDCLLEIHLSPDIDKFRACANSTEGDLLLAEHGARTKKAFKKLDTLPRIVFNDKYKKRTNEKALKKFTKTFCHYIPDYCKTHIKML